MDRPKVISWLLDHRDYWKLPCYDLVEKMREARLINRRTYWADVNTEKLINQAKAQVGEYVRQPFSVRKGHYHKCPDCGGAPICYTAKCPYPKEVVCEACKYGAVIDRKECRFDLQPLHCDKCGVPVTGLGTCDDIAYCSLHTIAGDDGERSDEVISPKGGSRSGYQRTHV